MMEPIKLTKDITVDAFELLDKLDAICNTTNNDELVSELRQFAATLAVDVSRKCDDVVRLSGRSTTFYDKKASEMKSLSEKLLLGPNNVFPKL
tara:strand:+ start:22211 stop:22489 length:279 start_codon:yes stop_codon:yes gene_type:complete